MLNWINQDEEGILGFRISGKLTGADYQQFIRRADEMIQSHGSLSVLADLTDMDAVDLSAALQDLKFTVTRLPQLERFAVVGDSKWSEWLARISDWLPTAEAQHFVPEEMAQAWVWLGETRQEIAS